MNAIMGEEIEETGDFIVNEKEKNINLTEEGVKKVEKFLNHLVGAGFVTRLLWVIFTTSGIIAFIKTILSK